MGALAWTLPSIANTASATLAATGETLIDRISKPSPEHFVELAIVDDSPGVDVGQAFVDRIHDPSLVIEWLGRLARKAPGLLWLHGSLLSSSRIGRDARMGTPLWRRVDVEPPDSPPTACRCARLHRLRRAVRQRWHPLPSSAMLEPMRWSNDKAARFQALREQEARGELSPAGRAELDALLDDLDADEADALGPATQRLRSEAEAMAKETESLEAKARELLRIAEEEERLLADARSTLERLRQRSAALAEDYLRVMGHELAPAR